MRLLFLRVKDMVIEIGTDEVEFLGVKMPLFVAITVIGIIAYLFTKALSWVCELSSTFNIPIPLILFICFLAIINRN